MYKNKFVSYADLSFWDVASAQRVLVLMEHTQRRNLELVFKRT